MSPVGAHTSLGLGGRPTFKYRRNSWLDGKERIIARTEFYIISYACLVFRNNIVYSIWSGFSFEKNLRSNGSILNPNKHSQDLLLVLDVMVITEKNSVINGKDQRLIIAVSFMFMHFPAYSDHNLNIFWVMVQLTLFRWPVHETRSTQVDLVNFTLNARHFTPRLKGKS